MIRKKLLNSGILYAKNIERVADRCFIHEYKYDLIYCLTPMLVCLGCGAVGFILLATGILL